MGVGNLMLRLLRNPFRAYVHPVSRIEALLAREGLQRVAHRRGLVWQADVYERARVPGS